MRNLENRVIFWQFPSFMDVPLGPWNRHLKQTEHSRLQNWKLSIDWIAEQGVTHFIGIIESPLKGARQSGCPDWPFHYVCSWEKFPGTRVFPERMLEENRIYFCKIISYMRKKGIKPFLHHYNHFVPFEWFKNQEDLIESKMLSPGVNKEDILHRGSSDLTKGICANSSSYRNFIVESWCELFHRMPGLEGLLITLGESNYCPCRECSGGVPRRERWDHILAPEFINTMSGFARLFTDTLHSLGKKPIIRCYHGGGDRALAPAMPKEATYLIKYSGFNAIDCGPDPICHFWLNAGHDLWFVHEFAGLENASMGMWVNPEHCFNVVQLGNEKRISGQVAFYNDYWGRIGMAYPGMEVNLVAGLAAFRGEEYDEKKWENYCREKLGPNGVVYLKAGKLLSQSVLNIDKIISGSLDDGCCFGFNYHFKGEPRFPGLIGEPGLLGTEAHPWRSNLAPLRRYKEYLLDNPWCDDIASKAIKPGEEDPLEFWADKVKLTLNGLSLVEALNVPEDSPYFATHELFLTASRWIGEFTKFWQGMIQGKVYYWGANSIRTNLEVQKELANRCIRCLESSVDAIFTMKSLYYEFPPLYMNWAKAFCGTTIEEKYEHYRGILEDVKEEFEPLISGRYYQWPDGGTWYWPEEV